MLITRCAQNNGSLCNSTDEQDQRMFYEPEELPLGWDMHWLLQLNRNNCLHKDRRGNNWLGGNIVEKGLEILVACN